MPTSARRYNQLVVLVLTPRAAFATAVWLNAGLDERPLTSACFILDGEDSIPGLLDWNRREGLIFQQGGGAGVNLSAVRSSRKPVSRGGLVSGPVSSMRAADAWAATIRSWRTRARRGAKMVVRDADHPDITEFIRAKAFEEQRPRGARRRRLHAARRRRRPVAAGRGHDRRGGRDAARAHAPAGRGTGRLGMRGSRPAVLLHHRGLAHLPADRAGHRVQPVRRVPLTLPYDSHEARAWAAANNALITGVAYGRSAELAARLGPFAEFERNREPMLAVLDRHIEALDSIGL
jgi:ribonucleotide reductase alpha subunit